MPVARSLAKLDIPLILTFAYSILVGPDPEAEWLCQHKHQPWYVAPIVKMEETKSEATECGTHKRECIAHLTLDEGFYESLNAQYWRKREEQGNEVPDNKFEGLKMSRDHSLQNEVMIRFANDSGEEPPAPKALNKQTAE